MVIILFLVHFGAGESDLALGAGERAEVAHLHHGRGEGAAEGRRVGREVPDGVVGAAAVEELLVRVQEPLLAQQVAVVGVVELVRRGGVKWRQVAVAGAGGTGAVGLERGCERGVDVGVVIDVVPEVQTLRLPDGVPAGERGHLGRSETLVAERFYELVEVEGGRRQVAVRQGQARRRRVPPPQRNRP